jgi:prepilin-type N-terminal cleavage/methylation domain-containing protein
MESFTHQNFSKKNLGGFTLIEILIVISLISTLTFFFVSIGLNFYRSQQLENQAQTILQILRRAQVKTMSVELDSSFGVYLTNDNYTLFKGDSYLNNRDPQYDEVFDLPEIINVSGLNEVVFLKMEGIPKENPAYCGGTCTPCQEFTDKTSCPAQDGCSWSTRFKRCTGTCTSCDSYQNQPDCQDQSGCIWYSSTRGGNITLSINGESRVININEMGRVNLQ